MPCRAAGALQGGLSVLPAEYPPVWRNESLVEDFPGGVVHDPYRWLEDTDSPATRACAPTQAPLCPGPARPCWLVLSQRAESLHLFQAPCLTGTPTCSSSRRCGTAWQADTERAVMGAAAGCARSAAA